MRGIERRREGGCEARLLVPQAASPYFIVAFAGANRSVLDLRGYRADWKRAQSTTRKTARGRE